MVATQSGARGSLIGKTLAGSYIIERKIGDGGMGTVYAARHARLPSRFAIKVLTYDAGDADEVYRRFRSEAEIMASLRHPNVVHVTDFNRLEDGTIYLAMEYLEGEDLQSRLRRVGRLSMEEVLPLCRSVGSALFAAHKIGVVHRDLKPQNLFLSQEDRGDEVVEVIKVLDFGVSKITRSTGEGEVTRIGRILGTPQYMSPEQALGRNDQVDGRTDQFALATIVYQALSGRKPFDGLELASILYHVVHVEPSPLHRVAPVAEEVSRTVARAMAKAPEERFPTILDFVRALEQAASASHETVAALPLPADLPQVAGALAQEPADSEERTAQSAPPQPSQPSGDSPRTLALPPRAAEPPPALHDQRTEAFHPPPLTPGEPGEAARPGTLILSGPPPARPSVTTLSGASGALDLSPLRQAPAPRGARALPLLLLLLVLVGSGGLLVRSALRGAGSAPLTPVVAPPSNPTPSPAPAPRPEPEPAGEAGERPALQQALDQGAARLRVDDLAGAEAAFARALRLDPRSAAALSGLARVAWEQRDYTAALRFSRDALALEPDRAEHHTLQCQIYYRMGDVRAARGACARAVEIDPSQSAANLILRGLKVR